MINSLANHMELFDFTLWNKSQNSLHLKGVRNGKYWKSQSSVHSRSALSMLGFQLRLHVLFSVAAAQQPQSQSFFTTAHDYRLTLVIGFPLQIHNVSTSWNCEYKFACTYNEVTPSYWKTAIFNVACSMLAICLSLIFAACSQWKVGIAH